MNDAVKQINDMMFRYAELFDTGRFDEFAALFEYGKWHKAEPGAAGARKWINDNGGTNVSGDWSIHLKD